MRIRPARNRVLAADLASLLAVVIVLAATINFAVVLPASFRSVVAETRRDDGMSVVDRKLVVASNYAISPAFILNSERLVPLHSTYSLVTGVHIENVVPTGLGGVRFVSRYLLLPREMTTTARAKWLLCYGCEQSRLRARIKVVWRSPTTPGLFIARVVR
jgi:hypothetical protein